MAGYYNVFRIIHSNVLVLLTLFAVMVQTVQHSSEQMKNACGPNKITLSSTYPEHMLTFPVNGVDDTTIFHLGGRSQGNTSVISPTNHSTAINFTPENGYFYRCQWVITTESNHAITAIFEFNSEDGYVLSAEDDFGFIDNCTTKRCLIESSTPALSLEFHTRQLHAIPSTRFTAKFYSTLIAYG
uniref:CUB domain-containing protein n=1 Tax=Parascaris univalens TaxID=6257 RepID=A0A915BBX7_PARUN